VTIAAPNPATLLTAERYWLLDLTHAGATYHLGNRQVDAPDTLDGTTRTYQDAIDVGKATDALNLFQTTPTIRSASVKAHLYPAINVPADMEAGRDLNAAWAHLRLWADTGSAGTVLYAIRGIVREVEYGAADQPVEFTIRENPTEDTGYFPSSTQRIDATTWADHDTDRTGTPYPLVIGQPGDDAFFTNNKMASPAYIVSTVADTLLVCGEHVAATSVRVRNMEGTAADIAVTNTADSLSQRVAVVDFTATALTAASGDELRISWNSGGGILGPDGTTALRKGGDVLVWALRQSTLEVDWGRVEAIRAELNIRFLFDCWIQAGPDESIRPSDWLQDQVLPYLPLSARYSDVGLYFDLWNPDVTSADAVGELFGEAPDANGNLPGNANAARVSRVKSTAYEKVVNEICFSYGRNQARGQYHGRILVTGSPDTLNNDSTASATLHLRQSYERFGRRRQDVSCDSIWDSGSAGQVVAWMSRRDAFPTREVVYQCGPEMAYLAPGDVVLVTDADLVWTSKVCLVDEIALGNDGEIEITVRTVEDPVRDGLTV
jgi:hypothetical protein